MIFPRYAGPPLIERVCAVENLTDAWRRVRSNIQVARRGRSAGPDLVTLRDFEADWAAQMGRLAEELRDGSYRPLPPKRVSIPKASGGERAIAILAIRDRVAQRAVQQVLTPLFEPLFLDCSYGCRSAVGVPEAVARVARYAEQGLAWVVDADIQAYFDSIDQGILLGLLRQRVDEPAILRLVGQWLAVGALQDGEPGLAEPAGGPAAAALRRGGDLLRDALSAPPPPAPPPADPYAAAAWEQPDPALGWAGQGRPGMPGGLWAALSLAQPAIEGARQIGPLLRRVGPQRLLIGGALAAGAVAAGELLLRARAAQAQRGTPQGGPLSPLLANVYLHPFDLAMTAHGARLVRFVDDFVIMCPDQASADRTAQLVERQLATLRLALNREKTRVVAYADGLEFLGQALTPRHAGPSLASGVASFAEAEQRLREQIGRIKRRGG